MRIKQAHISKSVIDFSFLESWKLEPYSNKKEPAIFLGMYREEDIQAVEDHNGLAVCYWFGNDAINSILYGWYHRLRKAHHVTNNANIHRLLTPFLRIREVGRFALNLNYPVTPLSNKIFVYCPLNSEEYHQERTVLKLREEFGHIDFIIGRGLIAQLDWEKAGNDLYDQCFMGLVLNQFAGGGQTITQLGLKGRHVVTNASDLPNCIRWDSIKDISKAIHEQRKRIGTSNIDLSEKVISALDKKQEYLNTKFYE